tara:strand:- start:133 stop:342 length:210 start_codon:yes stop_codon:yes gene_type:complete
VEELAMSNAHTFRVSNAIFVGMSVKEVKLKMKVKIMALTERAINKVDAVTLNVLTLTAVRMNVPMIMNV